MLLELSIARLKPASLEDVPICLVHCFVPLELYLTRKMSLPPELVLLSSCHPEESPFARVSQFSNLINQIQLWHTYYYYRLHHPNRQKLPRYIHKNHRYDWGFGWARAIYSYYRPMLHH